MSELKQKISQMIAERKIVDINGDLANALYSRFADGERWSDAVTFDEALRLTQAEATRISKIFGRGEGEVDYITSRTGERMPREAFSALPAQQQSDFCLGRSEANGK